MPSDSRKEPETQPSMPESKPTLQLSQLEIVKAQLSRLIDGQNAQREANELGFKHLSADIELVSNDLSLVKDRVTAHDTRFAEYDSRLASNSLRAKTASQVDLDHDAKLGLALAAAAEEKAKREALEKTAATKVELEVIAQRVADAQTNAIGTLIADAAKSKLGQRVLQAAAALLLAAMATAGGYLARGNVQPAQPTIILTPAPTVSK